MTRWKITIEAWPHSTGNGNEVDQAAAGDRKREFIVYADGAKAAFALAEAISMGVQSHPMVWQAPIKGVVEER